MVKKNSSISPTRVEKVFRNKSIKSFSTRMKEQWKKMNSISKIRSSLSIKDEHKMKKFFKHRDSVNPLNTVKTQKDTKKLCKGTKKRPI